MAKNVREISFFKERVALSWETWLSANYLKFEKDGKSQSLTMTSVYGSPKKAVDAVLVVADNLRAAAEASCFLKHQYDRFGAWPQVICAPGFTSSKIDMGVLNETTYQSRVSKQMFGLRVIMSRLGIPAEVLETQPGYGEDIVLSLKQYLATNKKFKKIVVFSSRGYSMVVAQELLKRIPKIKWMFYDNPFISEEDRIFEAEIIGPEGTAIDMFLANIARVRQDWEDKRIPLGQESINTEPEYRVVKKFLEKGYVLAMTARDWDYFDMNMELAAKFMLERRADFSYLNEYPEMTFNAQLEALLKQYQNI